MEYWRRGVAAGAVQTAGHGAQRPEEAEMHIALGFAQSLGREYAETAAVAFCRA